MTHKFKIGDEVFMVETGKNFYCEKKTIRRISDEGYYGIGEIKNHSEEIAFEQELSTKEEAKKKFNEWIDG
jgi:hypothetical protein